MNKKLERRLSSIFVASLMGVACVQSFVPTYAEETLPDLDFKAIDAVDSKEGKGISLTEKRNFTVSFEPTQEVVEDEEKEAKYAELLEKANNYKWTLSREKGYQDEQNFPHQWLGGSLEEWKTVKTSANKESEPFFEGYKTEIVDTDDDKIPEVQLTFTNKLFFGYNGIDNRSRAQVRNTILDYTGPYQLKVMDNDQVLAQTEVQVRPYDTYHTSSEIDQQLAEIAAKLNAKGIYAKVESIGNTVEGRNINAIFVSKTAQDLTDYQALAARAETEPTKVLEELEAGTLNYKVPVMYSNVHADEIIGSDGCMEFLHALADNDVVPYKTIKNLTDKGKEQVQAEMKADGKVWSELIKDKVTGVGYIQGNGAYEPTDNAKSDAAVDLTEEEMAEYYNIEERSFNVNEVLNDVFFIVVPQENTDGRTYNTRTNANSFDLNRDNTYQTQPETQAMTRLIATWNPVSFHEIHGYYTQYQVEPCSPMHEPNAEYDLFMREALAQGEAYGAASIANNDSINSFQMPMRDYLSVKDGKKNWSPFDDMSTSYTPQYALMHGVHAFTVELPYGSADAVEATKYGFIGNAAHVAENKKGFFKSQLEIYERGINNIDADTIDPWYVSQSDEVGKEADIFRPKYEENNNFYPEYYVIPLDAEHQQDTQAASDMITYLLRNDVKVKVLTEAFTVDGKTYPAGTAVIDMHQAKRNMANVALYDNLVLSTWSDVYSEPLSNFSALRGFDMEVDTTVGAYNDAKLEEITVAPEVKTTVFGEGKVTVLSNNSVDAIQAINTLLQNGKEVGMISEGEYKGDFLLNTADFDTVKDQFILVAHQSNVLPKANVITKAPKVYVPGRSAEFSVDKDGNPIGVRNYTNRLNTNYGWDLFAYEDQMGFELVYDPAQADVIAGGLSLTANEIKLVQEGKPYLGYSYSGMESAVEAGLSIKFDGNDWFDVLGTVEYEDDSLITAKYVAEDDHVMYGYGGNIMTAIPTSHTTVLTRTTADDPISGFISEEWIQTYKNAVTGIDYNDGKLNITLFANTMTNKAHQQDEYRMLSNAIYQDFLGSEMVIEGTEKPSDKPVDPQTPPTEKPNGNTEKPNTGDSTNAAALWLLLLASGAGAVVLKKKMHH